MSIPSPQVVTLFQSFGLNRQQKRELHAAWLDEPETVEMIALDAQAYGRARGNTGAGLLMTRIRRGDHYPQPERDMRPVTGWRYARGTHGETWVADPVGRDVPPRTYAR